MPGCTKMFKSNSEAQKHLNAVHLNKKEQCPECGISVKNLSTHISQIHKYANRYSCPECDRSFSKRCDMKLHIERVHNQRRYICPHCRTSVCKIREHLRVAHKIIDFNMDDIEVQRIDWRFIFTLTNNLRFFHYSVILFIIYIYMKWPNVFGQNWPIILHVDPKRSAK